MSTEQVFETGPLPEIHGEQILGDLQVRGWQAPQTVLQAQPSDLQVEHQVDLLRFRCQGDCLLRLPLNARLTLGEVRGDLSVRWLEEHLEGREVLGDVELRQVASADLQAIHGDLDAKDIAEDIHVTLIHGSADLRRIGGDCTIEHVQGDFDAQFIEGEVHAAAQGRVRLRLARLGGSDYHLQAAGDLYCYLPEDADARLQMHSEQRRIKVRLPQEVHAFSQTDHELTIGEGTASFSLSAGGAVFVFVERAAPPESQVEGVEFAAGLGSHIARQVESQIEAHLQAQMAQITGRLDQRMQELAQRLAQSGFSAEESERILAQARRAKEREVARAQERIRRAQEKLERKLEAQRRRSEGRSLFGDRRSRRQGWGVEPIPPPPPSPPEGPSEEERLMILRMLAEKKITAEQASLLLSSLEGET